MKVNSIFKNQTLVIYIYPDKLHIIFFRNMKNIFCPRYILRDSTFVHFKIYPFSLWKELKNNNLELIKQKY